MAGTAIAISAVTAAAAGIATSVVNATQGNAAANAAKNLADQQAAALKSQQDQANALAAAQATSGQTFGFAGEPTQAAIMTGLGFGGGGNSSPNVGSSASVTGTA